MEISGFEALQWPEWEGNSKRRRYMYTYDWLTAPHSSTLAWKIPWTEEPGRLQSMRSLRVGHDWATSLSLFTFIGGGSGNPLQRSCLENPRDGGAWWAAVYEVAQSGTRMKRLSSSSSNSSSKHSLYKSFCGPMIIILLEKHLGSEIVRSQGKCMFNFRRIW